MFFFLYVSSVTNVKCENRLVSRVQVSGLQSFCACPALHIAFTHENRIRTGSWSVPYGSSLLVAGHHLSNFEYQANRFAVHVEGWFCLSDFSRVMQKYFV